MNAADRFAWRARVESLAAAALKPETWMALVAVLVAAVVIAFVVEHRRDSRRDAELVTAHARIARDSLARAAATVRTDSVSAAVDTDLRSSVRADTVWLRAKAAADVPAILAAQVPDTVKIRELAHVDSSLIAAGDVMRDTTIKLRADVAGLQTQFGAERRTWQKERDDQAAALALSESRRRHWGLGATVGYALVRESSGAIRSDPGIMLGLTYRW
jgi:hypothetical protein